MRRDIHVHLFGEGYYDESSENVLAAPGVAQRRATHQQTIFLQHSLICLHIGLYNPSTPLCTFFKSLRKKVQANW
ncbi:hypothetical protein KSF_050760 [Reticulibacter mediterranei]|uniref:Uncharacterized protein n=1 Tax=Reticulibacter mediterranei TaxID=2778369 RepID=A0A8J3IJT0_9CHLR|nr:hypothetical protein KSF_050760 [Reticulibacter mediterranei]